MKNEFQPVGVATDSRRRRDVVVVWLFALTIYACLASSVTWPEDSPRKPSSYYQLQADGFRDGELSLKKEVPPGLARLPDPYDPVANGRFRTAGLHDMSFYRGKLYLYFGPTPAVTLFLPAALLSVRVSDGWAEVFFCALGFSVSAWVLCALRKKYFPETGPGLLASGVLALAFVGGLPLLLMRAAVYEVGMTCAYAAVMIAVAGVWQSLHGRAGRAWWLAVASLAYGFAVGARPALLFGAVILLVPVVAAWREANAKTRLALLSAAVIPIGGCGVALLAYNFVRFGNPLEFGQRYQMVANYQAKVQHVFSPHFFWFNFRLYFLEPVQWDTAFPFVRGILQPRVVPTDHLGVDNPFGVLVSLPLIWLAAAAPLAWRERADTAKRSLRAVLVAVGLLFGACALTLCFFGGVCGRYEAEFLPALVFLAVVGFWALDQTLAAHRGRRVLMRCAWGVVLAFSIAFNVLIGCGGRGPFPSQQNNIGYALLDLQRVPEAITRFRLAVLCDRTFAEAQCNLGTALFETGQRDEAMEHLALAVKYSPGLVVARTNLAQALIQSGRLQEAKMHLEFLVRRLPDLVESRRMLEQVEAKLRAQETPSVPPETNRAGSP